MNFPRISIRENRQGRTGLSLALRCFLILILVVSSVIFASRLASYHHLKEQKQALLEQKQSTEERIGEIDHALNSQLDEEEIIRLAREKFHLVFPWEKVYYNGQGTTQP